jgi:GTP-binding protein EngB required for normal cell division
VDLPGYGFAAGAKQESARFNKAVARYLKHRPNLCCVFALLDSGLAPQEIDLEFVEWLARNSVPFVLVFTKTDRGTPEETAANIAAFTQRIAGWFEQLPEIFRCSATTAQGRSELLGVIGATLDAIPAEPELTESSSPVFLPAEEVEPPFKMQVRAGTLREENPRAKKKLKGARPW